jgi:E3 ubiquitin-protein ligase MARCH6
MEEKECRVCREGEEYDHPLYAPCLCNGSILYCHQDCLEGWLKHSGKDKCELCGTVYSFSPKYSPDMPDIIPIERFITGSVNAIVKRIIPFVLRVVCATILWLCVVPYATGTIYARLISSSPMTYSIFDGIATGILLTGVIALTFIVLVSIKTIVFLGRSQFFIIADVLCRFLASILG